MENNRIKPVDVANELSTSFLDYSMSVIISRALPDVRDGLKPSQRRILYAMKELNLSPGGKTRKCSKIVGDTMGNYHPHGDAAIYGTLVNMAQDWSMRDILVIGQGNFGTPDGDPPAAARYTEAKLSGMGVALMADLDKDTVDFVPTYDNEHTEPTVFPSAFPNLLVNGGTGIAVGMATNMPPHNLGEVVDGICAVIDSPHMTVDELRQFIKGPDFPTGGDILGFSGIDNYFRTGRGSVRIRGKIDIEQTDSGKDLLIIREVPYGVNRAALQERIAELYKDKILTDISGIRDLSDEKTCIEIELKRDARPQVVMNQLYKLTSMETSFSVNMLAIHDNRPKTLAMLDAINFYIEHRREVVVRRTRYLLGDAEKDAERLERRGFRSFVVPGLKEAADLMRGLVRELSPASASYGDSMTLKATGILDELNASPDIQFYDGFVPDMDREEKWEIRRRGVTADLFLTGINAVSMKGTLHWVDMVGNRVAPVAFGPRNVILLAGANKLVATPEEARERIRRIAPLNARRHEDFKTPCMYTGTCADCNSPDRLCNIHMSIVKCFPKGRIAVILMEESGGL